MQMGKNDFFFQNFIQVKNCRHPHINQFFTLLKGYREEGKVINNPNRGGGGGTTLTWVDLVN